MIIPLHSSFHAPSQDGPQGNPLHFGLGRFLEIANAAAKSGTSTSPLQSQYRMGNELTSPANPPRTAPSNGPLWDQNHFSARKPLPNPRMDQYSPVINQRERATIAPRYKLPRPGNPRIHGCHPPPKRSNRPALMVPRVIFRLTTKGPISTFALHS